MLQNLQLNMEGLAELGDRRLGVGLCVFGLRIASM